jgi:hypothetical protein
MYTYTDLHQLFVISENTRVIIPTGSTSIHHRHPVVLFSLGTQGTYQLRFNSPRPNMINAWIVSLDIMPVGVCAYLVFAGAFANYRYAIKLFAVQARHGPCVGLPLSQNASLFAYATQRHSRHRARSQ